MDEDPETRAPIDRIEGDLKASRQPVDLWTEDDTRILRYLQGAVEAAQHKGYSEALLHETLTALYS